MNRHEFEFKVANMAMHDYVTLVAKKKCYVPEGIYCEVKLGQKEWVEEECNNTFCYYHIRS